MSITSVVEIIYWIVLKPFGFDKQECEKCKKKAIHHYDSLISKKIVSWTQLISIAILLIFTCYSFYDLFYKAYNPPQAEDLRNQLQKPESYFFDFLF